MLRGSWLECVDRVVKDACAMDVAPFVHLRYVVSFKVLKSGNLFYF